MPREQAVLIIGAGILQCGLIDEAHRLGLKVIATDGNPQAPGARKADMFLAIDTYDAEAHVAVVGLIQQEYQLCGVCCAGADVAPTVARVAVQTKLPGIPYMVAKQTHDKAMVRILLKKAGLHCYQPRYYCVIERDTAAAEARIGYPCVVKPRQQRASRGVTIVQDAGDLRAAVDKATTYSADDDVILMEEYLVGTEHSAEAIFAGDGTLLWWNIVDRVFDYGSGIPIELGHVNPSNLSPKAQQQIHLMLLACARALGVTWGAWKADVMMTNDGPKVLEVTARLSGGWDCQGTSPLTGRNPMRALLQLSCGLPVDMIQPAQGYAACAAILPQKSGTVQKLPPFWPTPPRAFLREVIWTIRPGETIHPAAHNGERAGFVLTHAATYAEAWDSAKHEADALAEAVTS